MFTSTPSRVSPDGGSILQFSGFGSILAVIFGAIGLKWVKCGEANNRGMALWGMWLGIVMVSSN
jgi:hypothetical protein